MSGFEEPGPLADWTAFREARDRFFAQVRPQAVVSAVVAGPIDPAEPVQPDPAAVVAGYAGEHRAA